MIFDVHSHAWENPQHFDDGFRRQAVRARGGTELDLSVRYQEYQGSSVSALPLRA